MRKYPVPSTQYHGTKLCFLCGSELLSNAINAKIQPMAIDVGANVGGLAQQMLNGGYEEVHAFEPGEGIFKRLKENIKDERASLYRFGVSDKGGCLKNVTFGSCWTLCDSQELKAELGEAYGVKEFGDDKAFDVTLIALDDFFKHRLDRCGLLKIDVEGYELRVFKGAKSLIKQSRPIIITEIGRYINDIGDDVYEFADHIFSLPDYSVYSMGERKLDKEFFIRQYPWQTTTDILLLPNEIDHAKILTGKPEYQTLYRK